MPTQDEIRRFNLHRKYGIDIANKPSPQQKKKVEGWRVALKDGGLISTVKDTNDKSYPACQAIIKEMVAKEPWLKSRLSIKPKI